MGYQVHLAVEVVEVVLADEVIEVEEEEVSEGGADAVVRTCGLFDFLALECLTDIL